MWPYWILFFLPAVLAIQRRPVVGPVKAFGFLKSDVPWLLIIPVISLFIGFRMEVGGDWARYLEYVERARESRLTEIIAFKGPGYQIVNWTSARLGWDIWGVNLFCGLVFTVALAAFTRRLPRPWLAMTVAVPYFITVVAMGYTRQGVALGFAMMGLLALGRGNVFRFLFWILLGATFHVSAVLLLPIACLIPTRSRPLTLLCIGTASLLAITLFQQDHMDTLFQNYVEAEYQSQGALIRCVMNAIPAMILLLWHRRFGFTGTEARLWGWLAIISLVLAGSLLFTSATTAVDRVALYMLPIQLVVFSHLPDVFGRSANIRAVLVYAVVAYYAFVHFVWLNFATHAHAWLPYRNFLLE